MKQQPKKIELRFGAMAPPLRMQLKDQGLKVDRITMGHLQKDADALTRLRIRGLIQPAVAKSAEKKILKKIIAILEKR